MSGDTERMISVIIPVYGEASRINDHIDHLRRLDRARRCEIIVVDGSPEGDTLRVIEDRDVIALRSARGRAVQMNAGAAIARGETLLFLHADTYLPKDGIEKVAAVMADERYVGGAFSFSFDSRRKALGVFCYLASLRSRLTRLPFGDHAIFLRRDYFFEVGGYPPIPIMEDFELMRRIKKRGDAVKILSERVTTSARRIEREGLLFCALRSLFILWSYSMGISPERLKKYYPDDAVPRSGSGRLRRSR